MSHPRVDLTSTFSSEGPIAAAGYAFLDGQAHDAASLTTMLPHRPDAVATLLPRINGFYAIVVTGDNRTIAAVDRLRTRPLYYLPDPSDEQRPLLTDDAKKAVCAANGSPGDDPIAAGEYLLTGRVSGAETLVPGVEAIPPGGYLIINDQNTRYVDHVAYTHEPSDQNADWSVLARRYERVLSGAIDRLVEYADGRPIAISLSAGHDSRLLAVELARREYDPVVAFTYGGAHMEMATAAAVAADLGLDWSTVTFDHDTFRSWYDSPARATFDRAAGWIESVPNPGLAFAMERLRKEESLPHDAVVVTGDGPQTTGEHIPESFSRRVSSTEFADAILDRNYGVWNWDRGRYGTELADRALASIPSSPFDNATTVSVTQAASAYERWDWRERQAKRIRSNPAPEHAGFDWWFPLWDAEVLDFWRSIPLAQRRNKRLHNAYVERIYGEASNLPDPDATFSSPSGPSRLERIVGSTPVLGTIARRLRSQFTSPGHSYADDPMAGMVSNETFDAVVGQLARRGPPPAVYFHALLLLDRIEQESVQETVSVFDDTTFR